MENQSLIKLPLADAKVSATTKLAVKSTEMPDNGNQLTLEVVIQQEQVTIDKLLAHIVKLEEPVTAPEGGLALGSHVTSVLQEQLTAKMMN